MVHGAVLSGVKGESGVNPAVRLLKEYVPQIDARIAKYFDKEIKRGFGFNARNKAGKRDFGAFPGIYFAAYKETKSVVCALWLQTIRQRAGWESVASGGGGRTGACRDSDARRFYGSG